MQLLTHGISAPRSGQQRAVARNVKTGDDVLKNLECANSTANPYRDGKHAAFALAAFGTQFEGLRQGHLKRGNDLDLRLQCGFARLVVGEGLR
jgi:hypothetical protein